MKIRVVACLAFLLNAFLFGSYYSVAKDALARIDPIVFTFFVMMALVPVALGIIIFSWHDISREIVKSGAILGSCLCLGLFMMSIALKYNSATSTAFFPSLNGFLATCCVGLFLRQRISKVTWFAGLVSVCGALLLIFNSPMGGARGALIAFIGSLFCTFYVFLADHEQRDKKAHWPLLGVQLLTMGVWASLIALLFGDWQMVHPSLPRDIWSILYISLGTTCLPTLITVLWQRHISPITVSFIYILEPILGALLANVYLHEVLPLDGYLGGSLIIAGMLIHTWGTAEQPGKQRSNRLAMLQRFSVAEQQTQGSWLVWLGLPVICLGCGGFILYRLGGLMPPAWLTVYRLWSSFPAMIQQGHSTTVALLIAQSLCWIIAWVALTGIGILLIARVKYIVAPSIQEIPTRPEIPASPKLERMWAYEEEPELDAMPELDIWRNEQPMLQIEAEETIAPTGTTGTIRIPSAPPVQRRGEKPLVQRRRRERRIRLAQIEVVE
jgi:drug/metabolite transporter (DMT)-like permease